MKHVVLMLTELKRISMNSVALPYRFVTSRTPFGDQQTTRWWHSNPQPRTQALPSSIITARNCFQDTTKTLLGSTRTRRVARNSRTRSPKKLDEKSRKQRKRENQIRAQSSSKLKGKRWVTLLKHGLAGEGRSWLEFGFWGFRVHVSIGWESWCMSSWWVAVERGERDESIESGFSTSDGQTAAEERLATGTAAPLSLYQTLSLLSTELGKGLGFFTLDTSG